MEQIVIVAELRNNKKVVVEPNYTQMKCHYRYLTDYEIENSTFASEKKYIWLETSLHTTLEEGVRIIFSNIEGTPVVFNRFYE